MKRTFFAAVAIVAFSGLSASAATIVSGRLTTDATDTPTVPGSRTYTLVATSDAGNIIGFNFDNPFGITAEGGAQFGQVMPFGSPSIMNDLPPALFTGAGSDIGADTHFLVRSADGIAVNAAESATALRGAYNLTNAGTATPSMPFAQVVLPAGAMGRVFGQFTVATQSGNVLEDVDFLVGVIPEPATLAMAGMGLVGMIAAGRRRK